MTRPMPRSRYSAGAIFLHWTIAALIIVNLVLGLGHESLSKDSIPMVMGWHKSIGVTVLALSLARLAWRLANPAPPLPPAMPGWQVAAARATHIFFYVAMIALPLTGWLMSSASPIRFPLTFFGLFPIPYLPVEQSREMARNWGSAHEILGYATIFVLALHVAGALKHHFIDRDDVLRRMLPRA